MWAMLTTGKCRLSLIFYCKILWSDLKIFSINGNNEKKTSQIEKCITALVSFQSTHAWVNVILYNIAQEFMWNKDKYLFKYKHLSKGVVWILNYLKGHLRFSRKYLYKMLCLTAYKFFKKELNHRHSSDMFTKFKSSYIQVNIQSPRKILEFHFCLKNILNQLGT